MTMEPLVVWEHPLSPYAQKVKIALAEKGLAFTAKTPQAIGSGATPEMFRRLNFRGEVPVLMVGDRAIADSSIILELIEDLFPDPPLLPKEPFARARARTIEEVCDTHFEAINWGLSEIFNFKRAEGSLAEAMTARAGEQIGRLHDWLEQAFDQAGWLSGEAFGWADLCAVPFVQGACGFGFAPPSSSRLETWLGRCRARPSVSATFLAAKEAAGAMHSVAEIVAAGGFKRQYRDHRLEWMIRSGGIEVVQKGLERDNIRFNSEPG
jgi:glutathione S-transferase/RNA polymerase-associated protein